MRPAETAWSRLFLQAPPALEGVGENDDGERQQRWRDRAIFERLALLDRLNTPPLQPEAGATMAELMLRYPGWAVEAGDRAHFTFWMENYDGIETDHGSDQLASLSGDVLVQALREPGPRREGRLEVWGHVAATRPGRAVGLLRALAKDPADDDGEIWRETLFGLRDAISRRTVARRVFAVLAMAPEHLLRNKALLSPASDLVETASTGETLAVDERLFWQLWDRLLAASVENVALEPPEDDDWVGYALNHPIGDLATALLNVMFRRALRAGQGLPEDLRVRLDRVVAPRPEVLRLARVILASRLVYLFAVDRTWVTERLLPFFDAGRSEDEAVALWRGYAWHGRINADLWEAFRTSFFKVFTPGRLARLGPSGENLAALLMVVGVELPGAEAPADQVRGAVRAMTPGAREQAVFWLYSHVAGPQTENGSAEPVIERAARDRLWHERVAPWLKRVWPRDRNLIETGTSERFALLAIATDEAFDDAVTTLLPYIGATEHWGHTITELATSAHPGLRPRSSLALIGNLVTLQGPLFTGHLRAVLDRIGEAMPDLRQDTVFRSLDASLQAAGR